jgi:nicotinamide mononucleotide transporter PnuC
MIKLKEIKNYFSVTDVCICLFSCLAIILSYVFIEENNWMSLVASLVGIISFIFNAKGNFIGQILIFVFCVFYGIVSYKTAYYGELFICALMTFPMTLFTLISWLKNPYNGKKSEVKTNVLHKKEVAFMFSLAIVVTVAFYFILKALNTASLIPSTLSVFASFIATYMLMRRSPYYSLGYILNDFFLIALWIIATIKDTSYLSMVICFIVFLVNDTYCYISWQKMSKRQNNCT